MTRLLRAAVLLIAVLALAGATGCFGSGPDENAYAEELNRIQNDFTASVAKAQSAAPSRMQAKAHAIQNFDSLETAIDTLIADLEDVDPPAKVESLHNELISEMQQVQVQVKEGAASLTVSDGRGFEEAMAQWATVAGRFEAKIHKTISGINDKLQE